MDDEARFVKSCGYFCLNESSRSQVNSDSDFARFNTIFTSLKALDEGYASKNYVGSFLRSSTIINKSIGHRMIEEFKILKSLSLDELLEKPLRDDEKDPDETCLVAQAPKGYAMESIGAVEWIKESDVQKYEATDSFLLHYKAYLDGNVIFVGCSLRGNIIGKGDLVTNMRYNSIVRFKDIVRILR
ncbi:hypothetical protein Tco_0796948 [Tanacetum coccineum]